MRDLFALQMPWWELVLRGFLVYAGIFLFMRLSARREVGEFTPFDLAVLLILSEAVSPALTGEERSWTGAMIVVATLLGLNWALSTVSFRYRRLGRWLEGEPVMVVRNGRVLYRRLRECRITHQELLAALRKEGCRRLSEVALAVVETDGRISVTPRSGADSS